MKLLLISICLCPLVWGFGEDCYGEGQGGHVNTRKLVNAAEDFAMDFLYRVYSVEGIKNLVISPYSLWSVLNLAFLGSAGDTSQQISSATQIHSKNDAFYGQRFIDTTMKSYTGTELSTLNKGYFDQSLAIYLCSKIHQFESVDFKKTSRTTNLINKQVNDATKGHIQNFLKPGDIQGALMVLLNAVYFKGTWVNQFDKQFTTDKTFHDYLNRPIGTVKMMQTVGTFNYANIPNLEAEALELPYQDSGFSMLIILPYRTNRFDNIFDLVMRRVPFRNDAHDAMDIIIKSLKEKKVDVNIPSFKIKFEIKDNLKKVLTSMGIKDLFTPKSDLSLFSNATNLFVDKAIQVAEVKVDEEGTVAVAVTGLIGTRSGVKPISFNADRPFIFLIRDMKLGLTIFAGIHADPAGAKP